MDWRPSRWKIALSLPPLLLLGWRLWLLAENAADYRAFFRWEGAPVLPALVMMLAAVCIAQLGPFLVLPGSALAHWGRPPRRRTVYILCICACGLVFLGEGFFWLAGWLSGSVRPWERPFVNLIAMALDIAGLLLVDRRA